jgi:hypothetical protein
MKHLEVRAEQIVGRERRERVSQLVRSGEGWFDSRRRVNSDVMWLRYSHLACIIVLSVVACSRTQPAQTSSNANETSTPFVAFCELLAHPDKYDKKTVRTKATQFTGVDTAAFRSLDCDYDDAWMRANCPRESCVKISNAIDNLLGKTDFRARRVVTLDMIGQFLAYDEDKRNHRFMMLEIKDAKLANPDDFKLRKRQ